MTLAPELDIAPKALLDKLAAVDHAHMLMARENPNAFMTYVLRDEETGKPILQTEDQQEWQHLFTKHRRLLLWAHVEAGKTNQFSIGRVLWELGKNPNLRIAIISNTGGQAQRICQTIAKYIESSHELHRVFPHLKRDYRRAWNNSMLFVERETKAKDPSVISLGIHGNILGARIDLLVLDDLLDYENTISPTQREDLWNWYHSTIEGRLTRRAKVICIGTAWHPEDIMHRFAKSESWLAKRYPVLNDRGESRWPTRWPQDRIEQKRIDLQSPIEFARQMLCVSRSDEDSRFKRDWINQCLERGLGVPLYYGINDIPEGSVVYTGVDLGVRVTAGADLSCLFTVIINPEGDRQVLDIQSGRWDGPTIVEKIVDVHHRYQSIVYVENVAAQQFIVDFTKKMSAVPVKPFATTGQKLSHVEFGIEAMATEFANAKWIIPSVRVGNELQPATPELARWVSELLYYVPGGHPGDRLMASWFARTAARMSRPKIRFGHIDTTRR